ncbi:MAG TPA: hypothetical protein VLL76_00655 [Candidatus Omnitrophota bacterium]|nr:hypothetical protein [Candidatus Omnitrophota bacterium]
MENREMYDEINALIGAVSKALEVSETEVVTAIEQGRLGMEMLTDERGQNFISATLDGKNARIYQGAIFRQDDKPEAEDDGGCGGGCSCGH